MTAIRSKQRVSDHGEVFTPANVVKRMIDLLENELERYDARVLEPACGSGNFLVPILHGKINSVVSNTSLSEEKKKIRVLHALMSVYGIELLKDNVIECRSNILNLLRQMFSDQVSESWYRAAESVTGINIIHGDALSMSTSDGKPIRFSEWSLEDDDTFSRREFQLDDLINAEIYSPGSLFEDLDSQDVFIPVSEAVGIDIEKLATFD